MSEPAATHARRPRRRPPAPVSPPDATVAEAPVSDLDQSDLRAALQDDEALFATLKRQELEARMAGIDPAALTSDSMAAQRDRMATGGAPLPPAVEARSQAQLGIPAAEAQWSQGPEPASIFAGAGPLPAAMPPGLVSLTTGPRPTDQVVDHYMNVHWDGTDVHEQARRFGVWPDQIGTELDRWIPVQASPEVRAGANLLVGLGAGLLDAFFEAFAKSIPGIGIIGQAVWNLRDGWNTARQHAEEGDWGGALASGIRYTLAGISGMVRNLGDVLVVASNAAHVLAPFTLGVSSLVAGGGMALAETCRIISAVVDTTVAGIDIGMTTYSVYRANQAEAQGQFERQAAFRSIARGHVFRVIESIFKAGASWVGVMVGAAVPTGAPTTWGAMILQSGRKFVETFGRVLGKNGWDVGYNVTHRLRKGGVLEALAGDVQTLNDASVAVGLGDVMSRSRDGVFGADYIERTQLAATSSEVAFLLDDSRQTTLQLMDEGMDGLEADPPLYTQALINQFFESGSGFEVLDVLEIGTRPSRWIGATFWFARWCTTMLADVGLEQLSKFFDRSSILLDHWVRPMMGDLEGWIVESKPAFDEWLRLLNQRIQDQRITMQGIRDAIGALEGMSDWAQTFADQGGEFERLTQGLIDDLAGLRIDPDQLSIPDWVPERLYRWAVDRINDAVDSAVWLATEARDAAQETWDGFADTYGPQLDERLDWLQQQFAAGGEVETLLSEQLQSVQRVSQQLTDLITSWDGRFGIDFDGAVDWLAAVAEQARGATDEARQSAFRAFIETVAQAYVDDWKRRHGDDVHENFWPDMPPHEIAAVREAAGLLRANYDAILASPTSPHHDEARRRRGLLDQAENDALATEGEQGREALYALWEAEERIARLAMLPLPIVVPPRPEPVVVHFAFDRPRDGEPGVDSADLDAAVALARDAGGGVHVVGHASVEGPDAYNLALGQRRADHVAEALRRALPGLHVTTESVGEAEAGSSDTSEYRHEDWRKVVVTVGG